jgi:hypothetical protein
MRPDQGKIVAVAEAAAVVAVGTAAIAVAAAVVVGMAAVAEDATTLLAGRRKR